LAPSGELRSDTVNRRRYFVYLMANESRMTYTGMTNSLQARVYQHKAKQIDGFTKRYNLTKLVHFEETDDVTAAIKREKEIKGWTRAKKTTLIEKDNPRWEDLASEWYER
jgi:putative endonuclease